MLTDEYRYKILKKLENNPEISQRELAKELGVSLGRANYCLKALIEKGLLKANNFRNSQNKRAYAYFLTPRGMEEKSRAALSFMKRKLDEHEMLKQELELLRREAEEANALPPGKKSDTEPC